MVVGLRSYVRRALPGALAVGALAFALYLLAHEFRAYTVADILTDLRAMPLLRVWAAVGLTGLGYVAITGYDALAARYIKADLPYRRTAWASATAYAFSQALGFPLLTGAPIRYRFYSSWGVDAPDVARIITFSSITMWLGFLTLSGSLFLAGSMPAPPEVAWLGPSMRPLGAGCLVLVAGYLVLAVRQSSVTLLKHRIVAPSPALALGQIGVAALDWCFSGAALYVLMPSDFGAGFGLFLGAYLLAQIIGFVSHVPGGIGVFEAVLIVSLGTSGDNVALVPSLIAFRAIYYLLPLLVAMGALGVFELRTRGEAVERMFDRIGTGVSSVVPIVAAGTVFVTGAFLLFSGALPFGRLGWNVVDSVPLVELAHFLTSVGGAALLLLAWGLYRRLDGAFHATLLVLGGTAVFAVVRGAGWPTALPPLAVLFALLPARREFFRRSSITSDPLSPEWLLGVTGVLIASAWLGFLSFRSVNYSSELWWRFTLDGDAPRFLRGSVGAAFVLFGFGVARLLRPAEPPEEDGPAEVTPDIVDIVSSAPDAHARLALIGDKRFMRSESGRSFIMYGVEGRAWISMGDPVGDPAEFRELVWRFRNRVHLYDGWPAFYQATPEHLPIYVDAGLTLVKLGEEALIATDTMTLEGGSRSTLRRCVRKMERDGGSFRVLPPEEVARHLPRLRVISDGWLEAKNTKEKSFSLGAFHEPYLLRSSIAVVEAGGEIVAFSNLMLGAPGSEFSADLMRYDTERSPTDVMLYLLTKIMLWGGEQGYRRFSLGMAPLSGLEGGPMSTLWSRLGSAVFRHGEHFYNFQGLRAFKEKWDPTWEPRYLACPGRAVPGVLARTSLLISGGVSGLVSRS